MFNPFARPLYVAAKTVGSACNLACNYCYYRDKSDISRMHFSTLRNFTIQYLNAQTQDEVQFLWHGGEPTLLPLSFYRETVRLQKKFGNGYHIQNCLQTNGIGITEEWAQFLKEENWLVGLSIDGNAEMHDCFRRDRAGRPTHERVLRAIRLLTDYGIDWNAMATVNAANQWRGKEFYDFFKELNCRWIQFSPVVERVNSFGKLVSPDEAGTLTKESVSPEGWGKFLCEVFDSWRNGDIGETFIQIFEATLANWLGQPSGLCTLSPSCGHALALEADGSLYSCDHFVFPTYRLGNIHDVPLLTLAQSSKHIDFSRRKLQVDEDCRKCQYHFTCFGECPRLRFAHSGRNYLCKGYHRFFSHSGLFFDKMAEMLRAGLPLPKSL